MEAARNLLFARALLKVFAFKHLTRFFTYPARETEISETERWHLEKDVRWAIDKATSKLPGKSTCFPRAIAAQVILRRRGISTTLYYGAATLPERGLTAHVWLQDGDEGIVGHREALNYQVLARYPEPGTTG
jgi:hypothetical protein